jgi:hypothetical protein
VTASLAVRNGTTRFAQRRSGTVEVKFGNARELLRDSAVARQIEADSAPNSIFRDASTPGSRTGTAGSAPMHTVKLATTTPTSGRATVLSLFRAP